MEQTRYASRLRYLDAADLDDTAVDFDGLDVRGTDDSRLGDVDGFLVDPSSGRVLYTVVDSGGWFTSRRFLVPIGHMTIEPDRRAMRVDVSRETLRRFPDFKEKDFGDFSDDELKSYEHRMIEVCCPEQAESVTSTADLTAAASPHYQQPAWWRPDDYPAERLHPIQPRPFKGHHASSDAETEVRTRENYDRELIAGRSERAGDDESPHVGGRAQPGDILGIETGGERTAIGDTVEDEDERRRAAERARR
jgi:hypothetical protein